MAIRLLIPFGDPPPVPDRLDDEESFYHVFVWMVLRYGRHPFPAEFLSKMIYDIFEDFVGFQGKRYLSNARMCSLVQTNYFNQVHIANQGLQATLNTLKSILMERYSEADTARNKDRYICSFTDPSEAVKKRAQAQEVMEAKDWLTSLFNTLLDNDKTDWVSDGVLKAHELGDRRIQSNTGKRKTSNTSMDFVPSESSSRPKRQCIENVPGGSGSARYVA